MKIDKTSTRTIDQIDFVRTWFKNNCIGTLEAATGYGKTFVGMMCAKAYQKKTTTQGKILVVVPTEFLKKSWIDDFESFGISNYEVLIINTAIKEKRECDLLILDEIHCYTSNQYGTVFSNTNYSTILGLSATLPDRSFIEKYCPVLKTVTLDQCEKNNWVSNFKIFNYGIELPPEDAKRYSFLSSELNRSFGLFNYDFKIMQSFLGGGELSSRAKSFASQYSIDPGSARGVARKCMGIIQKRKKFLQANTSKIDVLCNILELFPTKRPALVFSLTKAYADLVAKEVTNRVELCKSYHSSTGKNKDQIIADLTNGDLQIVSAAKSLDTGANLPSLELGVILAGTSSTIQGVQRLGRTLRYIPGKFTIIVEVYFKNTKDQDWLNKRQKPLSRRLIKKINNLEEIEEWLYG